MAVEPQDLVSSLTSIGGDELGMTELSNREAVS